MQFDLNGRIRGKVEFFPCNAVAIIKIFLFLSSSFFPPCFFLPLPHFRRYTNENAKHGAERRVSTIFNWPCTWTPRRYIFRSARLETAVCAHQRPPRPPRPQFYRAPRNRRPALREKIHSAFLLTILETDRID